jgi:hypothetical protein
VVSEGRSTDRFSWALVARGVETLMTRAARIARPENLTWPPWKTAATWVDRVQDPGEHRDRRYERVVDGATRRSVVWRRESLPTHVQGPDKAAEVLLTKVDRNVVSQP